MPNDVLFRQALAFFEKRFGHPPAVAAFAPGRVEVLGNHTDYNEGFVLAAAIDRGTFFLAAPRTDGRCLLADAVHPELESEFPAVHPPPVSGEQAWSNYVRGMWALLVPSEHATGFEGVIAGDIPLGAGLSSSAALEVSAGVAFREMAGLTTPPLDLARLGQASEHRFAGVRCGLLDQITSLFGRADHLVETDFRTLAIQHAPLPDAVRLLVCNTGVKHRLVESAYNDRRAHCEEAAAWFRARVAHPVATLRDVSMAEWEQWAAEMPPLLAKRSAHVIGENERVQKGVAFLREGRLDRFGRLMFESHASSRFNFQNSCPELDVLVERCQRLPGVLGARLTGGGFGGSVIVLVESGRAVSVGQTLARTAEVEFGRAVEPLLLRPSDGARTMPLRG